MFDQFGQAVGQAETSDGDGSWLGSIRGKCATGKLLFCPTDDGIARVEQKDGKLGVTKVFSDTSRFVDASSKILVAKYGIYVAEANRIWRLRMK